VQNYFTFVAALVLSAVNLAQAPLTSPAQQPSFSIAISFPPVIRAESELLLEIAMINTSDKDISYSLIAGWPGWQMFQLDVRDAAGRPVPQSPAGKRISAGPRAVSGVIAIPLAPGKAWRPRLILNRVYDLSQPGEYTVQARRMDSASGVEVKSDLLTFRVPP
jgi:hypothetical protein